VTLAGLDEAARLLAGARHVACLTGAGISAESGIPTFRDALTGLWAHYDPVELATPAGFARHPDVVWDWYAERRRRCAEAKPNPGHLALAELERRVPRFTLITQNVDGLHQEAGSRVIHELHGSIRRVRCAREGRVVHQWEETGESPPPCPECGGMLRPDVVWFGEVLPEGPSSAAWEAASNCDVFLSVGTSNLVEPAASLPWLAHRRGAKVILVNPSMAGQRNGEGIVQVVGKAGEVLPLALETLRRYGASGRSALAP